MVQLIDESERASLFSCHDTKMRATSSLHRLSLIW